MSDTEEDKKRYAVGYLTDVANALTQQIIPNDKVIENKKIAVQAVTGLSNDIRKVLGTLRDALRSEVESPEERLKKSSEIVDSIIESLESAVKNENNEVLMLEATQAGIRRTLESLHATAKAQLEALNTKKPVQNSVPDSSDIDWDDT